MRALDIQYMWQCLPEIMKGIPYALLIAVVALIFGSILGLVTALIRIFKIPVLKQISAIYIAIIRGTPLMVQILVTYYGIPRLLEWVNYKWGTNVSINSIPAIYFMFSVSHCIQAPTCQKCYEAVYRPLIQDSWKPAIQWE